MNQEHRIKLENLALRRYDWDGYNSHRVNAESLIKAAEFCAYCEEKGYTIKHISSNDDGNVTFEFRQDSCCRDTRELHLEVYGGGSISYIRAWGTHIEDEMDSGTFQLMESFDDLYKWVRGEG